MKDTMAQLLADNDHNEIMAHMADRLADMELRIAALEESSIDKRDGKKKKD